MAPESRAENLGFFGFCIPPLGGGIQPEPFTRAEPADPGLPGEFLHGTRVAPGGALPGCFSAREPSAGVPPAVLRAGLPGPAIGTDQRNPAESGEKWWLCGISFLFRARGKKIQEGISADLGSPINSGCQNRSLGCHGGDGTRPPAPKKAQVGAPAGGPGCHGTALVITKEEEGLTNCGVCGIMRVMKVAL